jgi:hypothetical protein
MPRALVDVEGEFVLLRLGTLEAELVKGSSVAPRKADSSVPVGAMHSWVVLARDIPAARRWNPLLVLEGGGHLGMTGIYSGRSIP